MHPAKQVRSLPIHYFTRTPNVGDQINPWLLSTLFGLDTRLVTPESGPHLLGIGSLISVGTHYSRIWGTGLVADWAPVADLRPERIHAVRGKLTYAILRKKGLQLADIPLGDPAYLMSRCVNRTSHNSGQGRIGIAAHYVDRDHSWVRQAISDPDIVDLDVHLPVHEFLGRLSACDVVISSSLHGLIIAETFSIPNVWIELSDRVHGQGFKFRDWFSLADHPQTLPAQPNSPPKEISRRASLHEMRIPEDALISAFPGQLLQEETNRG
jgi:pyruvyltransferase